MGRGDPRRRGHPEVSLRAAAFALGFVALAGLVAQGGAARNRRPLPDTVDAYGIVFDQWVKEHEPKTAILVVRRGGKTVFAKGYGADPQKPTLIASLSKAITGACIATLVRDGKLSFTTPLRDALPQFFKQYGAPIDQRLIEATVEELLVHRAGLRGNADDDSIYGIFAKRASSGHGWVRPRRRPVLSEYLLKDRLARHPGGRYSYSNTGYEILIGDHRRADRQVVRGLLRRGGVRHARHRRAEAASRLADAGGHGRLVCAWARTISPSSTSSIRRIRFSATPSKPGSIRRRPAGRRPTATAGTVSA